MTNINHKFNHIPESLEIKSSSHRSFKFQIGYTRRFCSFFCFTSLLIHIRSSNELLGESRKFWSFPEKKKTFLGKATLSRVLR